MEKLELQKIANEVRKDIVTALHSAKARTSGRISVCSRCIHLFIF